MRINNSSLIQEIQEAGRLQSNQGIPTELSNSIIPVMEVNPKLLRKQVVLQGIGSGTVTLTNGFSDRDFYITAATLFQFKVAADTGTDTNLRITTADGVTTYLLIIPGVTLTANQSAVSITCPMQGVLIKRNTTIQVIGANISRHGATLTGYFVENPNA